jgi:hypothetical protein
MVRITSISIELFAESLEFTEKRRPGLTRLSTVSLQATGLDYIMQGYKN